MTTLQFQAEGWCRGHGATPGYAAQAALLERLAASLAAAGGAPFAVTIERWPVAAPHGRNARIFCRIAIEVDPAAAFVAGPLRAWFQWQHPRWQWSWAPRPASAMLEAVPA